MLSKGGRVKNLSQGSSSILEYFNKLTKLWDELSSIAPVLNYYCEIGKLIAKENMKDKVSTFFFGLNENYEHLMDQIMLMDPVSSIDKVYSMLVAAERKRSVYQNISEQFDATVMIAQSGGFGRETASKAGANWNNGGASWSGNKNKGGFPRRSKEEKAKLICDHCGGTGHDLSTCFKVNGIPDWYKDMKEQRSRNFANTVNSETGETHKNTWNDKRGTQNTEFTAILQQLQEMTKYMKGRDKMESNHDHAQFVSFAVQTLN